LSKKVFYRRNVHIGRLICQSVYCISDMVATVTMDYEFYM